MTTPTRPTTDAPVDRKRLRAIAEKTIREWKDYIGWTGSRDLEPGPREELARGVLALLAPPAGADGEVTPEERAAQWADEWTTDMGGGWQPPQQMTNHVARLIREAVAASHPSPSGHAEARAIAARLRSFMDIRTYTNKADDDEIWEVIEQLEALAPTPSGHAELAAWLRERATAERRGAQFHSNPKCVEECRESAARLTQAATLIDGKEGT